MVIESGGATVVHANKIVNAAGPYAAHIAAMLGVRLPIKNIFQQKIVFAGTHCRPEGGEQGKWVKLGWAYNTAASEPQEELANEPHKDPQFPEIVIRGAAAMIPALGAYVESPPSRFSHYGGYYTMTDENWPLIGAMAVAGDCDGAFMVAALSGFGSMAACAAGRLCAAHVCGADLPGYATHLSLERYADKALMAELAGAESKGLI